MAIEANDFARVPGGLFARGFIRTYAREVGVDPAEAVAAYSAATQPVANEPDPVQAAAAASDRRVTPNRTESPGWSYVLVAVALLVGFTALNRSPGAQDSTDDAAPAAVAASGSFPAQPETVATTGSGIEVEVHAQGLCWVRAVVDGEPTFTRLMQPGERHRLTGERDVVLRVGDPGALSYTVNGRRGEPLGAPKVPVTVRVGADGQIARAS